MKIKTLLIAISCTIFLFTSCEKEEMYQGGVGGGGGNDISMKNMSKTQRIPTKSTIESDLINLAYPDSLSCRSQINSNIE